MGGQKRFLGDPVVVTQAMPSADANSQVAVLYGNLSQAAMLGNRRGITVMESLHDKFAEDEIAYRGTQRFDINVHSVETPGTTAGTTPGPLLGVISAAS
jgi:HK97 family phage major capsid protein